VLSIGGLGADSPGGEALSELRRAVADHAALKDALATVGKRRAFLVQVEPTTAALADAAERLSKYSEQLVFASRPALAPSAAVHPREPVARAGANTMRLEVPYHWRVVGTNDRANADLSAVRDSDKQQVRWQPVKAGDDVNWSAVQLKKRDGMALPQ